MSTTPPTPPTPALPLERSASAAPTPTATPRGIERLFSMTTEEDRLEPFRRYEALAARTAQLAKDEKKAAAAVETIDMSDHAIVTDDDEERIRALMEIRVYDFPIGHMKRVLARTRKLSQREADAEKKCARRLQEDYQEFGRMSDLSSVKSNNGQFWSRDVCTTVGSGLAKLGSTNVYLLEKDGRFFLSTNAYDKPVWRPA